MTRPEELPELWEQQASEYPASEYVAAGALRNCARELRAALDPRKRGCSCPPGRCLAPKVMGQQMACLRKEPR